MLGLGSKIYVAFILVFAAVVASGCDCSPIASMK